MLVRAELLRALIADQPISAAEVREVARHILRLVRAIREVTGGVEPVRERTPSG